MLKSKKLSLLFVIVLLSVLAFASAYAIKVIRVIDGDTIELANGEKVRYIGVDTPETVHPSKPVEFMGKEASEFNKHLVLGRDVRLEYDIQHTDKYGRTLAYVFLDDNLFVNAELIKQGYAQLLTIPPNVKYQDLFSELQTEARNSKLGLWNADAQATYDQNKPTTDNEKYYITATGKKYHRGGCRYLSKSAYEITKEDASARGYTACLVCIGASETTISPSSKSSSSATTPVSSGRCQAITKKGTQCKRNASPGSKYCWQHGGK